MAHAGRWSSGGGSVNWGDGSRFPDTVLDERSSGSCLHCWSIESLQQQLSQWMDTHGCSEAKVGYAYDKRANVTLRTIREVASAFSDELSVGPETDNTAKSVEDEVVDMLAVVDAKITQLRGKLVNSMSVDETTNATASGSDDSGSTVSPGKEASNMLDVLDAQIAKLQARHDQLVQERDAICAHAMNLWIESVYQAYGW
ncbi:uncharacterized protein EV420DRAFT_1644243 [Desarmillaria tabescens]|uniref:Uncharacterized protein n=1 Tax=Armillaria tabescens TaxID=1929756 RepID=A0AA39KA58_ARMTA|nr:uncharacterized protein EV420DRAFT_1644243 [Desarmillaria tabescens]KAK0457088.1 hypothetical protein EV420DRAFT_1644243 [Desarmillaria tabescens]